MDFINFSKDIVGKGLMLFAVLLVALVGCQSSSPQVTVISYIASPPSTSFRELFKKHGLVSEHVGFVVWDPLKKQILTAHNENKTFLPASVAKVLVTLTALEVLGPQYRFKTQVRYTGRIKNGVLKGKLYLVGGGDPLLLARDLMKMAQYLKQKRLKRIEGDFILDDSRFRESSQIVPNKHNAKSYNPSVSALSSEFNRFFIHWKTGPEKGKVRVHATPHLGLNVFRLSEGAQEFEYHTNGKSIWGVPQTVSLRGKEKLPIKQSALHTGLLFRKLCLMQGIHVPAPKMGKASPKSRILLVHQSRPLVEITEAALEYSNNLVSTLILLETAKKLTGRTLTISEASHVVATRLKKKLKLDSEITLLDGSGLSSKNRITARQIAKLLSFADKKTYEGRSYLSFLPVGGWTGTLSNRLSEPDTAFRIWAKTGTLDYATALAGYFFGRSKQKRIFAIFVTDFNKRKYLNENPKKEEKSKAQIETWIDQSRTFQNELLTQWVMKY